MLRVPRRESLVIQLLVIAEAGLLRGALEAVLAREDDIDVTVVGEAAYRDQHVPAGPRPDVAVIDMDVSNGRWLAAVHCVARCAPECATVVLTARPTPRALQEALQAQVRGFASKQLPPRDLVTVIRQVAVGHRVIDPKTALDALSAA